MRIIEVITDPGNLDTLYGIAEQYGALDHWEVRSAEEGRAVARMLVEDPVRQKVMDALQSALGTSESSRILVIPVEAALPLPQPAPEAPRVRGSKVTREELYAQVSSASRMDRGYVLLVLLSTIVAAIGLVENNVAVIIGAMLIAPLLGPNMALALGATLGDLDLVSRSLRALGGGLGAALALSAAIGLAWPTGLDSPEIAARTVVGLDSVTLALASGAAGVLSLTMGLPSILVGVMVAVALLPPAATAGLLAGAGDWNGAAGAGLLLAVNVVCVILAAQVVLFLKGVRPRTWLERRRAQQSLAAAVAFSLLGLLLLLLAIFFRARV